MCIAGRCITPRSKFSSCRFPNNGFIISDEQNLLAVREEDHRVRSQNLVEKDGVEVQKKVFETKQEMEARFYQERQLMEQAVRDEQRYDACK